MTLKQVHVGGLGGLHYELYYPDTDRLFTDNLPEDSCTALLSANSLFWGLHFKPHRVLSLAKTLLRCNADFNLLPTAYRAIAANPELFAARVQEAILQLCDQSIGMQKFYRHVETLAILCQLYSDLEYKPHTLTLYEGFTSFELSSLAIYNNCLNPTKNPYLNFLHTYCLPIISKARPNLIWLNGRISLAAMALARLSREIFPNVHIAVVGHSSEYYSLNKITKYLIRNEPLFSMIDSIILDDSEQSRQELISALTERKNLSAVPNLIYADKTNGTLRIKKTPFRRHSAKWSLNDTISKRPRITRLKAGIDPSTVANIKLFPGHACYWNKCTFCGINKKYHESLAKEEEWDITAPIKAFKDLADNGVRYVWSIDEAIPPKTLRSLAKAIIKNKIEIIWQVRSRFEPEFLDDNTCELLAGSGLKEIRFGLESASPRILKKMKKFSDNINLALIKKIVHRFDKQGISVHCPVIIGYPTETADDRQYTYNFLSELAGKCRNFSFNINIFSLDVRSPLFIQWDEHGITSVKYPCAPEHFLGNLLEWQCIASPFDRNKLEMERNNIMRRLLYPWMSITSVTPPHVFYRLCETIRNTLTFKTIQPEETTRPTPFSTDPPLCLPDHVTIAPPPRFQIGLYQLYNWNIHSWAEISIDIAQLLKNPFSQENAHSRDLDKPNPDMVKRKNIKELYERGFLVSSR